MALQQSVHIHIIIDEAYPSAASDKMQSSGFQHAPASKYFLLYLVVSALLVTATDSKHYFYLHLGGGSNYSTGSYRHWQGQWQWWRVLSWAAAFTNSTEVLFAAITLYQLRVVERMWGTRKFLVSNLCQACKVVTDGCLNSHLYSARCLTQYSCRRSSYSQSGLSHSQPFHSSLPAPPL